MSDIIIRGGITPPVLPADGKEAAGIEPKGDFGRVLREAIMDIDRLQKSADQAIVNVQLEKAESIHEAVIALEKASISFKAMMQVRNKILEAYQEVMRMQV